MSAPARLVFRLDPRAGAAFQAFARRAGPEVVDAFTKALAFDAARRTVQAIEEGGAHGDSVDTGRYRAGWSRASELATGRPAGSEAVERSDDNPAQADDGAASVAGAGLSRTLTLANNVEYGPEIEYGTASRPAGLHVTRAVLATRKTAERVIGAMLHRAWRA